MENKTITKIICISLTLVSQIHADNYYKSKQKQYDPYQAQNGSYRGEINTKNYRPKREYVHEYNHQDGSHVRSYYRTRKNK